jgi:hypothetical protein
MCVVYFATIIISCSISSIVILLPQVQAVGLRSTSRRELADEDRLFYNSFEEIKDAVENIENKQQQQQQPSYYEYAESLKYNNIDTPDIECLLSFHENNDDCYYNNGRVIFGTDVDPNEQLIADGQCNFHTNLLHYKAECIEDIIDFDSGKSTTFNLVKSFCVENICTVCADPHDGSAFSMIDNNHHNHHNRNHDDTDKDKDTDSDTDTDTDTDIDVDVDVDAVRPPVFISHHGSVFGVCALDPNNNGPDYTQMYLEFSGNYLSMETCRLKDKDKENQKQQQQQDDDKYNDDDNYAPDDVYTIEETNNYRKELNNIQLK